MKLCKSHHKWDRDLFWNGPCLFSKYVKAFPAKSRAFPDKCSALESTNALPAMPRPAVYPLVREEGGCAALRRTKWWSRPMFTFLAFSTHPVLLHPHLMPWWPQTTVRGYVSSWMVKGWSEKAGPATGESGCDFQWPYFLRNRGNGLIILTILWAGPICISLG